MNMENLLSGIIQNLMANWILHLGWLGLCGISLFLGPIVFGWDYKQRIDALEKQQSQPQTFNVAGDLITVDQKPIARFVQKFEMLDEIIPLANGQILTFFAPAISVEYLSGEKEAIELPRATFDEVVKGMEVRFRKNPELFKDWEPLHVRPDKLREMLEEHEDDDP